MYTSAHTHKTWLQIEGGTTRARTILSLSPSSLLKHSLSMCSPTEQIQTYTRTHTSVLPPSLETASRTLWSLRQGDRKTEKEISRASDVCAIYTPAPISLPHSLSLRLHPPFPQFQVANSAVCQLHSLSSEITCKHSFHLNLLRFPRNAHSCAAVHGRSPAKMTHANCFWWARKLKSNAQAQRSESASAVSPSARWIIHWHELQEYVLTLKMSSEKCIQPQGHGDDPEEHTLSD